MTNDSEFKVFNLDYKKGDLIIKEGDYGISVYRIATGKAEIFTTSGGKETHIDTRGPGDLIGVMAFLYRGTKVRTISARALEDSVIDVWHPITLAQEYNQIPPIIKLLADQSLKRLIRMQKIIEKIPGEKTIRPSSPSANKGKDPGRNYYRKEVTLNCVYRPVSPPESVLLTGLITDISRGGVRMAVRMKNALRMPHRLNAKYIVETVLPNGKELNFTAKLNHIDENAAPGRMGMGMEFLQMDDASRRALGFFLMP